MHMAFKIGNIFCIPGTILTVSRGLKYQNQFMKDTILKDIDDIKKVNDGSLKEDDFKKIRKYYGNAVPAILGEGFCLLRGTGMSDKERASLTYLGSATGLFDDFFDHTDLTDDRILELLDNQDDSNANSSNELLFLRFYRKALENTSDVKRLRHYAYEVHLAQVKSREQYQSSMNEDELKEITFLKGGVSLLFYRAGLEGEMSEPENELLYNLGALMQLENDIFDIYKDYQGEISTLATTETKISHLRSIYRDRFDKTKESLRKTSFSEKNKKKFFKFISLIICRGFVCLDCLEENEKLTGNKFELDKYIRKQLICDMEKPKNILKTISYYSKFGL